MKPGIYLATFQSSLGHFGSGIVVIENGKIHGGDTGYVYTGTYKENIPNASATIAVKNFDPQQPSVFGMLNHCHLTLVGTVSGSSFSMAGSIMQQPDQRIAISGRLIADMI